MRKQIELLKSSGHDSIRRTLKRKKATMLYHLIPFLIATAFVTGSLFGCASTREQTIAQMQTHASSFRRVAIISILEDGCISIHKNPYSGLLSERAITVTDVPDYHVNDKIENALLKDLKEQPSVTPATRPMDREQVVQAKQKDYSNYPYYNKDLKPYLDNLRTEGYDALLIVFPYKYSLWRTPKDPFLAKSVYELKGYGVYEGPYYNSGAYISFTMSLYSTDTAKEEAYYIATGILAPCKVVWPSKKALFAERKFTDFPEDWQIYFKTEIDKLIDIELPNYLVQFGFK